MSKFRSAYDLGSRKKGLVCLDESKTKQSEADACDVNRIVARWLKSGGTIDLCQRVGQFLDVADIPDYKGCLNFVASANSMFAALPADIRERFDNDPGAFLAFADNPENADAMIELGLAKAVEGAAPLASAIAPDTAAASQAASADAPKAP